MPFLEAPRTRREDTDLSKRKINSSLAAQLRKAVADSGLSISELGRQSGVAVAILSRFMRNERTLTLPVASKLCEALGLKLAPAEPPARRGRPKRKEE